MVVVVVVVVVIIVVVVVVVVGVVVGARARSLQGDSKNGQPGDSKKGAFALDRNVG